MASAVAVAAAPRTTSAAHGAVRWRRAILPRLRRVASPVAVVVAWWLATRFNLVDSRQLASPEAVVGVFAAQLRTGVLQSNLLVSLTRVCEGLAIGIAAGVFAGCISGTIRWGENAIDPVVQMMRTVPVVALTSLFIVWFGIQELPKVVLVAVAAFFPVYLNTFNGIRNIDARLVEAAQGFGLGRFGLVREVVLPGALPQAFLGLRIALGVSWLVLVFAEQINAQAGIGYLLTMAQGNLDTAGVMAGIVTYAGLGIATDSVVRLLEARFLRWRRAYAGS